MLVNRKCARIAGVHATRNPAPTTELSITGKLCRSSCWKFRVSHTVGAYERFNISICSITFKEETANGVQLDVDSHELIGEGKVVENFQPISVFLVREKLLLACMCMLSGIHSANRFLRYASCCAYFLRH